MKNQDSMKKLTYVKKIRCSDGTDVNTVDEWKQVELARLSSTMEANTSLVEFTLKHGDEITAILSVNPVGRPLNRKDSKPRAKAAKAAKAVATTEV
jgi:hypothetical protein